ncbi:MAG TPA: hypothetical protein VGJ39_00570 [Vicinamibacterales bacterium]|jgi:hypothetical protein
MAPAPEDKLRLPVVSAGAEYLVMGLLMRRHILTFQAPRNNEGYDLIAIHPDPKHCPTKEQPLKKLQEQLLAFAGTTGIELLARDLGVARPVRRGLAAASAKSA